jgi:hypothetical protein
MPERLTFGILGFAGSNHKALTANSACSSVEACLNGCLSRTTCRVTGCMLRCGGWRSGIVHAVGVYDDNVKELARATDARDGSPTALIEFAQTFCAREKASENYVNACSSERLMFMACSSL